MGSGRFSSLVFGFAAISLLAGCGAVFVNEGSKYASLGLGLQNADANKPKVNVPPEACVISNFDDGSKNINPKLYGGASGSWSTSSFGGNTVNSDFVVTGGANGTKMAAHVFGDLVDQGNATYPDFTLQGKFRDSGYYDASAFTGIKFYYKCPADDVSMKRRFGIGTAATLPGSDGGTCQSDCYNNFGAMMDPSNDWALKNYAFADLKREAGWGSPVTPPDLTDHLKEFIYIKWANSGDNHAGTYKIDYWVDEIEFY
ncbi:MAG TPA: hypothetical protein VK859_13495 [bacterium]|jgi:hypothetical protein|nr:hypothetical protein [bacterium]